VSFVVLIPVFVVVESVGQDNVIVLLPQPKLQLLPQVHLIEVAASPAASTPMFVIVESVGQDNVIVLLLLLLSLAYARPAKQNAQGTIILFVKIIIGILRKTVALLIKFVPLMVV